MHSQEPKLFIFDVGQVVYTRTAVVPRMAEELGLDHHQFLHFARPSGLFELQIGRMGEDQFWQNFQHHSGVAVGSTTWGRFFQPQPLEGTLHIIEQLKKKFRVVAGTNTIEAHFQVHMANGHYDPFDKVYASHQLGLLKPDPAFYLYILEREHTPPSQAIFIDDNADNVRSAREIGIHAILFEDPSSLREKLAPYYPSIGKE
ncbi:MAG TPA: HAD family phosphatase [Thermotogota bacterium]|nr:HAD family phosphatase [Thermotogota bacterium]